MMWSWGTRTIYSSIFHCSKN